jgi:hypothetical protein
MQQPTARHGQVGFRRVKLPVSFCQRTGITSEDGSLIKQPSPPDPLIHAADRLPDPALGSPRHDRRNRPDHDNQIARHHRTGLAVIAGTEDRQHAYVALTRGTDANQGRGRRSAGY